MPLVMLCSRLRRYLTDLESLSLLHSAMSAILSLVGSARDPANFNVLHELTHGEPQIIIMIIIVVTIIVIVIILRG